MPIETTPTRRRRTTELTRGTHELVIELQARLNAGESFDNRRLTEIADKRFGGTRGQGTYTSRDAYDALEVAVNKYLLETNARELMQREFSDVLASVLRPLTQTATATRMGRVTLCRAKKHCE